MSALLSESIRLRPIFIGGTGRSGTTILRHVLGAHQQVVSLPKELRIIVDPGGALDLARALSDDWDPYRADAAIRRFLRMLHMARRRRPLIHAAANALRVAGVTPPPYTALGLEQWFGRNYLRDCTAELIARIAPRRSRGSWTGSDPWQRSFMFEAPELSASDAHSLIGAFVHALLSGRAQSGETHWIEDTPGNITRAPELLEMFPHGKLIHVFRHPLDVVASYRTRHWGGSEVRWIAARVAGVLNKWLRIRETLPADAVIEVSLEEMAASPAVLRQICRFCDLPFSDQLLRVQLNRTNSGRWRTDLLPEEAAAATAVLLPAIVAFGYESDAATREVIS